MHTYIAYMNILRSAVCSTAGIFKRQSLNLVSQRYTLTAQFHPSTGECFVTLKLFVCFTCIIALE